MFDNLSVRSFVCLFVYFYHTPFFGISIWQVQLVLVLFYLLSGPV